VFTKICLLKNYNIAKTIRKGINNYFQKGNSILFKKKIGTMAIINNILHYYVHNERENNEEKKSKSTIREQFEII